MDEIRLALDAALTRLFYKCVDLNLTVSDERQCNVKIFKLFYYL